MSSEWQKTTLGNLVSIRHGFAFKGEFFTDQVTPFQLTTPGNFAIGGGFQLGKGKYYNGPVPPDYVLREGDLVVTMTDLSKAADTLGYSAIVPHTPGTTWLHNQRVGLIRAKADAKLSMGYVHYLMRSASYRHWVLSTATGSTVKHTSPDRILGFQFELPPLGTQDRIAEVLTTLEDRIAFLRQTNATLEAIAQALFKSWFVDFDPVRAKMEGRVPDGMDEGTAALFPNAFEESDSGFVPRGWTSAAVYDLAAFINGAAYKTFEPNRARRGLPIIKIAELKAGVTEQTAYSDVQMPDRYRIETGDILFSWSGNPDTSIDTFVWADKPAWLNQHIFRVLPHVAGERAFILQLLKHSKPVFTQLARNKQTTGLGHVTVADLKRLHIAKPSPRLLTAFASVVAPIQERVFLNECHRQTLAAARDNLLPRLVSGQLRIEQADELLEAA